ncbi:MAG: helix-turn-helix transcriptional regulator [Candidatus Riflebacteria bacterium]|nr:helix-turn-helix transcriptional regulator [Candidatus Riflebacteria bacterium]
MNSLLELPGAKLVAETDDFSLYHFRQKLDKEESFTFKTDNFGIFFCIEGYLSSSPKTLSYFLQKNLIAFSLKHDCIKTIPAGVDVELLILLFSRDVLKRQMSETQEKIALSWNQFTPCQCSIKTCSKNLLNIALKLLEESGKKYWGSRMMMNLLFQELLIHFVRLFADSNSDARNNPAIQEVKNYISANYREEITLDDITSFTGISRGHLCKLFKEATGQTIVQYINYYRIFQSCELLISTDLSIEKIMEDTGFNNLNYFYRTFKKVTGKLPAKYRKNVSTQ